MTRRLTLAILATVFAALCVAGVAAYWAARAVLLADLDETLRLRAAALPELARAAGAGHPAAGGDTPEGGRYVIRYEGDRRTVPRVPGGGGDPAAADVTILAAAFSTLADGRRVRAVTVRASAPPQSPGGPPAPVVVTYSGSAEGFDRVLGRLAWTFAGCGVGAAAAAAIVARRLSRSTLRPLAAVADLVGTIDEARLDRRVPVADLPAELVATGDRLNGMLAKLESAFALRRRFLADASHELRTPVAALVTGLEVALMRDRSAEAYRAALGDALTDAEVLRRLVERLMEQVRSERLDHREPWATDDVVPLLRQCARSAAALGEPRGVTVDADLPPALVVRTQPGRLRSVATNLLANAVEYNRPGGTVRCRAWVDDGGAFHLVVRDTGLGIPADLRTTIFEPFVRGDAARTNGGGDGGHFGLGLYVVRTHVEAMGGRCSVDGVEGEGSEFRVDLPAEPAVPAAAFEVRAVAEAAGPASHQRLTRPA